MNELTIRNAGQSGDVVQIGSVGLRVVDDGVSDRVAAWQHETPAATSDEIARAAGDDHPELSWQERGLCAQTDPEAFFPEKGGSTREAKKVCVSCDVRAECLEYALENDERFGIWGGLSERERRRLKKLAV